MTIEGYQESVFYVGEAQTLFGWHLEDFYVHAANYQHLGAPKVWYVVPATYGPTFEKKIKGICLCFPINIVHKLTLIIDEQPTWTNKKYSMFSTGCAQFIRHMSLVHPENMLPLTPAEAKVAGWRAFRFEQKSGDMMVTWPAAYHSGINLGLNVNEAAGIGMKNWVNGGKGFRPCKCSGTLTMDWSVVDKYL